MVVTPTLSERIAAIQMVTLRKDRLLAEGRVCEDAERLRAINAELEVMVNALTEIREQQIVEQLERTKQKPKRRWWRRG